MTTDERVKLMGILESFSLQGRKAVVTGSGQGLGRTYGFALAEAGADVCIADINEESAVKTAAEIAETCGVKTFAVRVDVADEASVDAMYARIMEEFGGLDVAVANAGVFMPGNAEDMSYKDWRRAISIDLDGVFLTARGAARIMIPQKRGSIINISSINGHRAGTSFSCSYYAAKGAVLNLTRALAREWGPHNIRVNTLCPGSMMTEMLDTCMNNAGAEGGDEVFQKHLALWKWRSAFNRLGLPEELNGALIYLASDASCFTTGADIVVDGGYINI